MGHGSRASEHARLWIHEQVMDEARGPAWFLEDLADALRIVFAQLFRRIGDCRLPIRAGPTGAAQLLEVWTKVSELRIKINQVSMDPPNAERQ